MNNPLLQRRAGILLHITSLPGPGRCGSLGADAYRFVDFLAAAGHSVWQTLPVGPPHDDGSPYQCLSSHAGDPALINIDAMIEAGWLNAGLAAEPWNMLFADARRGFERHAPAEQQQDYAEFVAAEHHWLDDYALFRVLREEHHHAAWVDWPAALRDREPAALAAARRRCAAAIQLICFEQYVFFHQWLALKEYAHRRGVLLFGDMPIFVAHDSADVWAQRDYFQLDADGRPTVVAGVPPDYFSATGQRWGNPHYRWERMQQDGFQWWINRVKTQLRLFDLVRIDHFRGFESYWEIPADHPTAMHGRWIHAPGDALFQVLCACFDPLPVVAEDLGIITAEVEALRLSHGFPGMKILQFAFDGGPANPYLPHNHQALAVVYTGTHDNDTTLGWYGGLAAPVRAYVDDYLHAADEVMPWPLIRACMASVATLAVIPMQDALALDGAHRMNTPGTSAGNWRWRFEWTQLDDALAPRLCRLAELYGRVPPRS